MNNTSKYRTIYLSDLQQFVRSSLKFYTPPEDQTIIEKKLQFGEIAMRINKPMNLIFWILLFESIGFLQGLLTQANIYTWYEHLNKSLLTPPGFIFSVVWIILYALLAVIAWILSSENQASSKKVTVLFVLQMLMNWAWTPLFFGLHLLTFSAIWLVLLTCVNVALIIEASKTCKTIAWLLIPYLIWLIFASYLNVVIALIN